MPKTKRKVLLIGAATLMLLLAASAPKPGNMNAFTQATSLGTMTTYAAELTQSTRWEGSGDVWRVRDGTGGYLKDAWFQDDVTSHWYMLGSDSISYAGLITDASTGKTYYMNVNHDGTYSRMVTQDGTYSINGKSVYLTFNQSHDGSFGAITSGLSEARSTGVNEKALASIPTDSSSSGGSQNVNIDFGSSTDTSYNSGNTGSTSSAVELLGALEEVRRKNKEDFKDGFVDSGWN